MSRERTDPEAGPAVVVLCTCPDAETAAALARVLVERGLAGCAQVLTAPIRSIYRWQGRLHDEAETLLLLKADARAWPQLRDAIVELHPYDVPEVLACPADGNAAYLAWLAAAADTSSPFEGPDLPAP